MFSYDTYGVFNGKIPRSWNCLNPHPLLLANIGKISTFHTARRQTKREEIEVAIRAVLAWGGGGGSSCLFIFVSGR
jgi:hypothetical protein